MQIVVSVSVRAQSEGNWVLQYVDFDLREPNEETIHSMDESTARTRAVSESSGDVFAASANWTKPKSSYQGGETVTLTINASIDEYVWNGKNDGWIHIGYNFMRFMQHPVLTRPALTSQV